MSRRDKVGTGRPRNQLERVKRTEEDILNDLRRADAEAVDFFRDQAAQERDTVRGLLRVLGVSHDDEEIEKNEGKYPEPIDIIFRDARFQVTEVLNDIEAPTKRRRDAEYKERAKRSANATKLRDLLTPIDWSSQPLTLDDLMTIVSSANKRKVDDYRGSQRGLDFLVYVSVKGRYSRPLQPVPHLPDEAALGWRSISVVMEHFGWVIWTAPDAPTFLADHVGRPQRWDARPESIFRL